MVVQVGGFVRAGDDQCLLRPRLLIAALQLVHYLRSLQSDNVFSVRRDRERLAAPGVLCLKQGLPQVGGFAQNTAVQCLTGDLRKREILHMESEAGDIVFVQRTALLAPYRRQLGIVAQEQQMASLPLIDEPDEVVQEVARTEGGVIPRGGDHGTLIDDEQGVGVFVVCQREGFHAQPVLAVDILMDRESRKARILRQHLRRPAGRREQHTLLLQLLHGADEGGYHTCLARAGVSAEDESLHGIGGDQIMTQNLEQSLFLLVRFKGQLCLYMSDDKVF